MPARRRGLAAEVRLEEAGAIGSRERLGPAGDLAHPAQVLAPELEAGDVVVMDNLAAHKVAGVQEAIRAGGASVLYLPSYSPDLNPIEQVFAKLKALLRKAAARTKETLWATIGNRLDAFCPGECRNYLANCGYEFTSVESALAVWHPVRRAMS